VTLHRPRVSLFVLSVFGLEVSSSLSVDLGRGGFSLSVLVFVSEKESRKGMGVWVFFFLLVRLCLEVGGSGKVFFHLVYPSHSFRDEGCRTGPFRPPCVGFSPDFRFFT